MEFSGLRNEYDSLSYETDMFGHVWKCFIDSLDGNMLYPTIMVVLDSSSKNSIGCCNCVNTYRIF